MIAFEVIALEVAKIFNSSSISIEEKFDKYFFLLDATGWDDSKFESKLLDFIDKSW